MDGMLDGCGPSALELEWIAQIRMHFDTVCETSARMRKTLSCTIVGGESELLELHGCLG